MDERPGKPPPGMSPVSDAEIQGIAPVRSRRAADSGVGTPPPPVELGNLLNAGWAVFTKRLWTLIGLQVIAFALLVAVMVVLVMSVVNNAQDGDTWEGTVAVSLLLMAGYTIAACVALAAATWVTVSQLQAGRAGFGEALGVGIQRLVPLLAVGICASLLVGLVSAIPDGVAYALDSLLDLGEDALGTVTLLGNLGALLFLGFLASGWAVVLPVVVVEGRWFTALGRSWDLTRGYRWTMFFLMVVLWFLLVLFAVVPVVGPLLMIAALAFVSAVPGVTYYALRHDKEGLDIDDVAGAFD